VRAEELALRATEWARGRSLRPTSPAAGHRLRCWLVGGRAGPSRLRRRPLLLLSVRASSSIPSFSFSPLLRVRALMVFVGWVSCRTGWAGRTRTATRSSERSRASSHLARVSITPNRLPPSPCSDEALACSCYKVLTTTNRELKDPQ
jgi:hypothetical protein